MAEVQRRLEAFTVEVEELTQVGFFTDTECKAVVKKLFEFENKINSMNKVLEDFKEYISYIISLHRMIRIRRNKTKIADKKHHLEYRILQRVKNLYEMAITRFPENLDLFFTFFQFCKESQFQHASKTVCDLMLKYHKNNEQIWLTLAQITLHDRKDPDNAIKLLQQGIGIHKESGSLYLECIQYEILLEVQENGENLRLKAKLEVYLNEAKKHVRDYDFYLQTLTLLRPYDFTKSIQLDIVKFAMRNLGDIPHVWDYLADCEMKGIHFDIENGDIVLLPLGKRFVNWVGIYERGLDIISAENRQQLWNMYLERLVNYEGKEHVHNYTRVLNSAMEKASTYNCLAEKYYFVWLEAVDHYKRFELLKCAVEKLPSSIDLWLLRLRIDMANKTHEEVIATFEAACKSLKDKALPVWEAMFEYHKTKGSNDQTKAFLQSALEVDHVSIKQAFKPKYIRWLATKENLGSARNEYKSLTFRKPYCKEMYEVMLKMEMKRKEPLVKALEWLHETSCNQFGEEHVDVWINYVKFYNENFSLCEAKDRIGKLVIKVKKVLNEQLVSEFYEQYDELITSLESKHKKMRFDKRINK